MIIWIPFKMWGGKKIKFWKVLKRKMEKSISKTPFSIFVFADGEPQLNLTQLNFNFNWGWDSFISSFRQATHPATRRSS